MKYVVVILDGASGWALEELGGKTTLEAAHTPNLDALAREGLVGLAQTVPEGAEPSSSAACTSILGYDPVADYVGRGAIEAASMGIELGPDEVALRLNLVTIADGVDGELLGGAHHDRGVARDRDWARRGLGRRRRSASIPASPTATSSWSPAIRNCLMWPTHPRTTSPTSRSPGTCRAERAPSCFSTTRSALESFLRTVA